MSWLYQTISLWSNFPLTEHQCFHRLKVFWQRSSGPGFGCKCLGQLTTYWWLLLDDIICISYVYVSPDKCLIVKNGEYFSNIVTSIWDQHLAGPPSIYSVNSCLPVEEVPTELLSNTISSQTITAGLNKETRTGAVLGCVFSFF